jgi:GNAT superfamily N-acetyltransferase
MPFTLEFCRFPAPDGPLQYVLVPWDSDTFGFPIQELRFPAGDSAALARYLPGLLPILLRSLPSLVFTKIPIAQIASASVLTRHGFYPVETMVSLNLGLEQFRPVIQRVGSGLRLRDAVPADMAGLTELARSAFLTDRLHVDPHLPKSKADERFARWVRRGFDEGDTVFVYEDAPRGRTIGFFQVRAIGPDHLGVDLSLAAVDLRYQKSGFGLLMYQAVLEECRSRGYRRAETHITVNNMDVLNLFARLGFLFRDPVVTFHRYQDSSEI